MAAGARARAAGRRALRRVPLRREQEIAREEIERARTELGLQPLRWPEPFPFDSALAMRVATYAKSIGRAVPFAQAAFRQAFAGGPRSCEDPDNVLIAAAACEMHPAAVLRGSCAAIGDGDSRASRAPRRRPMTTFAALVGSSSVFPASARIEEAADLHVGEPTPLDRRRRGMRANRAYRLIVRRGGLGAGAARGPRARRPHRGGRDRQRRSRAVLGSAPPGGLASCARALRADLAQLEAEEFIAALGYRGALMSG